MTIETFGILLIWFGIVLALVLLILARIGVVPFDGLRQKKWEPAARLTPYSRRLRVLEKRRREYANANPANPAAAVTGASPVDAEV